MNPDSETTANIETTDSQDPAEAGESRSAAPPKLRVGFIGCGRAGVRRMHALARFRDAETVFAADSQSESLARLDPVLPASVPRFFNGFEALKAVPADAIIISTPPVFHEELALAALETSCRCLLVEKPVTCTQSAARRLLLKTRERKACCKVGSNLRHFAEVQGLLALIREGRLGRITSGSLQIGHDGSSLPSWGTNPAWSGGGTLLDNGVHVLDLARLIGLIPDRFEIEAAVEWLTNGIDRHATWTLDGAAGRYRFESSWRREDRTYLDIQLEGDAGKVRLLVCPGNSGLTYQGTEHSFQTRYVTPVDSWLGDTLHFLQQAVAGKPPEASLEDGMATVALVEQIYLSAQEGRRMEGKLLF
jgi:predicted dehydrogenase